MNTLTKTGPGTAVATTTTLDAMRKYAAKVAPQYIIGDILKYNRGNYFSGQASTPVKLGTKFVAFVDQMVTGYVRWANGRPSDQRLVNVISGVDGPLRKDLGELDQTAWELDMNGKPRDPWQETTYLPMMAEDGKMFTFTASSKGGLSATGKLIRAFIEFVERGGDPEEYPMIAIESDDYPHKVLRTRIEFPVLKIIGWIHRAKLEGKAKVEQPEESEDPGFGMDDEIPF